MNALLTIETGLSLCKITVRMDSSKHNIGVDIPPGVFDEFDNVYFDVKEIEPGENESIVISSYTKQESNNGRLLVGAGFSYLQVK